MKGPDISLQGMLRRGTARCKCDSHTVFGDVVAFCSGNCRRI